MYRRNVMDLGIRTEGGVNGKTGEFSPSLPHTFAIGAGKTPLLFSSTFQYYRPSAFSNKQATILTGPLYFSECKLDTLKFYDHLGPKSSTRKAIAPKVGVQRKSPWLVIRG